MRYLLLLSFSVLISFSSAQVDLNYQLPSQEILELADAPLPPSVMMNSKATVAVLRYRHSSKTIAELSEPELRLAGLRINPATNISSRQSYYYKMEILDLKTKEVSPIDGMPQNAQFSNFSFSPDESKVAFTNTAEKGVELWLLDLKNKSVRKLSGPVLNANMGMPMTWFRSSDALLVKMLPQDKKAILDKKTVVPSGPTVSVSEGKKAPNRTYQDLLKNRTDEANFEQLTRSDLLKVELDGERSVWKTTDMYRSLSFSPDGNYIMVTTMKKPFSYLVPYYRFPYVAEIYTAGGKLVKTVQEVPLTEDLPKGFQAVRKGMRSVSWRADQPSTIYWVEALDEGDPANEVEFRDAVYQQKFPFVDEKEFLIKTRNRFSGIRWGKNDLAVAYDRWRKNRNAKTYIFNPSDSDAEPTIIYDRNYQDRYSDPGSFVSARNEFGWYVLLVEGDHVFLTGDGYSKEGIRPFVDKLDLKTQKAERLWQADGKSTLERVISVVNIQDGKVLTRIESKNSYPNYYFRNIFKENDLEPVTRFKNPFASIQNVQKEVVKYKREDGVELSGVLYLPPGYDKTSGEKLPMLMWAYPREYKDKKSAGQVTSSPNQFTYISYGSPVFWVTKGFAVLDRAAFPILGEGDEEPNDSFVKQLVANAKAAIDAVDDMGYIDRNRVAVGGHSYGAFMTANLLTHSDLFAAGIARSGAYNRTLTPFGFQAEERTYWESPDIYFQMSPFMHAHKMKSPLLLIHGEADNNSGTYPMQSERYFNALKGHGAPVRLVVLPKESHGYSARESRLHMLWEQEQWLEKYVKNKEF